MPSQADIDAVVVRHLPYLRRRLRGMSAPGGFGPEDVESACIEWALVQARRYDPARGMRLDVWVRQAMAWAAVTVPAKLAQPRHHADVLRTARNVRRHLESRGERADDTTVETYMGWAPGLLGRHRQRAALFAPASLDAEIPHDGGALLHEVIAGESADPGEAIDADRALSIYLDSATGRDRAILEGVLDGETFAAIGDRYGLSRGRAQQISNRAIGRAQEALMGSGCRWPGCGAKHLSGGFCSRDYSRAESLGCKGSPAMRALTDEMIAAMAAEWARRQAPKAPVVVVRVDPEPELVIEEATPSVAQGDIPVSPTVSPTDWERRARCEVGDETAAPEGWTTADNDAGRWSRATGRGRFWFVGPLDETARPWRYQWTVMDSCPCPHGNCTATVPVADGLADFAFDAMLAAMGVTP